MFSECSARKPVAVDNNLPRASPLFNSLSDIKPASLYECLEHLLNVNSNTCCFDW